MVHWRTTVLYRPWRCSTLSRASTQVLAIERFGRVSLWQPRCIIKSGDGTMTHSLDLTDGYRVEVSGWDAKESFFVEKTLLDWEGEGKKEIALRNSLRE